MSDNDIILLGNVLKRFLESDEFVNLIGVTFVIDGVVDVTEREAAVIRRVGRFA